MVSTYVSFWTMVQAGGTVNIRASGHPRTCLRIANSNTVFLLFVDDSHEIPQISVVLNDYTGLVSGQRVQGHLTVDALTLMSNPFSLVDSLGARTQCHKVAFDNVLRVTGIQPQG